MIGTNNSDFRYIFEQMPGLLFNPVQLEESLIKAGFERTDGGSFKMEDEQYSCSVHLNIFDFWFVAKKKQKIDVGFDLRILRWDEDSWIEFRLEEYKKLTSEQKQIKQTIERALPVGFTQYAMETENTDSNGLNHKVLDKVKVAYYPLNATGAGIVEQQRKNIVQAKNIVEDKRRDGNEMLLWVVLFNVLIIFLYWVLGS